MVVSFYHWERGRFGKEISVFKNEKKQLMRSKNSCHLNCEVRSLTERFFKTEQTCITAA